MVFIHKNAKALPLTRRAWNIADSYGFISAYVTASSNHDSMKSNPFIHRFSPSPKRHLRTNSTAVYRPAPSRRYFHDYFVTHLPSSSLHPDSRSPPRPHHKLPRSASTPHPTGPGPSPAAPPPMAGGSREMTVLRIPLKSAKHHFGASVSRGTRPYNEDTFQAGVIEMPAFAKRAPISLTRSPRGRSEGEGTSAESASGDPQVFYFGVFDGHGGVECSGYLREHLHEHVEKAVKSFELTSSLKTTGGFQQPKPDVQKIDSRSEGAEGATVDQLGRERLSALHMDDGTSIKPETVPNEGQRSNQSSTESNSKGPPQGVPPLKQDANHIRARDLELSLISKWQNMVGGYFKRFRPEHFSLASRGQGHVSEKERVEQREQNGAEPPEEGIGIEAIMTYAFLKADLDFITAQVGSLDEDVVRADRALNEGDVLGEASKSKRSMGGKDLAKGGSTCSVAMISTPTPTPFWHPASPSSLITSHVGDTRILLCSTSTGLATPLTTNHHPSSPTESNRLRRYAATFVTDSFGEERMSGLANTRSFGDILSKRLGVSAEPEIRRLELEPAEYAFLVLVSDGVSGTLSDQEIVDIVKEARTPDQGAKDVVGFATEVSREGDNATCLVVRLGGWERRVEGGLGAMGTKEVREWKRQEATDPRSRRT
ncbi:MAG: hypothetical protein M1833_005523 [Piccolia ochrophora]|nr:MAG: hypothetical protein M1833_005523 [Piccolia ochrophora]